MNDKSLKTVGQEVEKINWVWIQLAQVLAEEISFGHIIYHYYFQ